MLLDSKGPSLPEEEEMRATRAGLHLEGRFLSGQITQGLKRNISLSAVHKQTRKNPTNSGTYLLSRKLSPLYDPRIVLHTRPLKRDLDIPTCGVCVGGGGVG